MGHVLRTGQLHSLCIGVISCIGVILCIGAILENYANQLFKLAGQEGLEPPTCGFGDRCSAN